MSGFLNGFQHGHRHGPTASAATRVLPGDTRAHAHAWIPPSRTAVGTRTTSASGPPETRPAPVPPRVQGCRATVRPYADTHSGSSSVASSHAAGGDPAFPEATTPPTMAHVVSTSPPTWEVTQKPFS